MGERIMNCLNDNKLLCVLQTTTAHMHMHVHMQAHARSQECAHTHAHMHPHEHTPPPSFSPSPFPSLFHPGLQRSGRCWLQTSTNSRRLLAPAPAAEHGEHTTLEAKAAVTRCSVYLFLCCRAIRTHALRRCCSGARRGCHRPRSPENGSLLAFHKKKNSHAIILFSPSAGSSKGVNYSG